MMHYVLKAWCFFCLSFLMLRDKGSDGIKVVCDSYFGVVSWTWRGKEGKRTKIEVYADEVELIQNGKTIGKAPCSAEQRYIAVFLIELVDKNGILMQDISEMLSVTVEGNGELLGCGSAKPDSEERFNDPSHETYQGQLLAVVRPTGIGEITIKVSKQDPMEQVQDEPCI